MEFFERKLTEAGTVVSPAEADKLHLNEHILDVVRAALEHGRSQCPRGRVNCSMTDEISTHKVTDDRTITFRCVANTDAPECALPCGPFLANDHATNALMSVEQQLSQKE